MYDMSSSGIVIHGAVISSMVPQDRHPAQIAKNTYIGHPVQTGGMNIGGVLSRGPENGSKWLFSHANLVLRLQKPGICENSVILVKFGHFGPNLPKFWLNLVIFQTKLDIWGKQGKFWEISGIGFRLKSRADA